MSRPEQTPIGIRAPHGSSHFEVSWADGSRSSISNRVLRGYCPCAGCQGHGGSIQFVADHDSELRDIAPVGNYALKLTWGDGHASGLYSFEYLRRLCDTFAAHGEQMPQALPILPRSGTAPEEKASGEPVPADRAPAIRHGEQD